MLAVGIASIATVVSIGVYVVLRILFVFSFLSGRLQGGSQTARSVEALQGSEKRWASDVHGSQSSSLPAQAQQTPDVHPIPLPESFSS